MKKKGIIALLMTLVMCFTLASCGGMNVKEELIAEKWCNVEKPVEFTMEFYETGTGKIGGIHMPGTISAMERNISFEWVEIKDVDNAVRVTLGYNGTSTDYQLVENEDGKLELNSVDGESCYMRESDISFETEE